MLLNFQELLNQYQIKPKGVIQLGCHWFEEKQMFLSAGIQNFVLVEPLKESFRMIEKEAKDLDAVLFNLAVSDKRGNFEMFVDENNQGQSSSLLEPDEHLKKYPGLQFPLRETVEVEMLDNLYFDREKHNILFMDIQGNELNALKGMKNTLPYIDCIFTEINFDKMYKKCVLIEELDEFLNESGFIRMAIGENINNQGWSDAFYLKMDD
jgi:FkbM family methyltransferase